jgi:hypothetical protein
MSLDYFGLHRQFFLVDKFPCVYRFSQGKPVFV